MHNAGFGGQAVALGCCKINKEMECLSEIYIFICCKFTLTMRVESGRTVNALELIRKYWFSNELIRRTRNHPSAEATESSGDCVSYVLAPVHTSFAM